jgi:DNA invertase Pin-like site-specific DNA recombinase
MMRVGLYARVSTHDQQTLPMQLSAMAEYASRRDWRVILEVTDVASGATLRPRREELLKAARRREIDVIVVWRLDRWGRSVADLVTSLNELQALDVGFVSLTEALDMTTPSGRALAGMLAVFAEFERDILRDRVKAGIAQARKEGRPHGRPATARSKDEKIRSLARAGLKPGAIAEKLRISRTSVRRVLAAETP